MERVEASLCELVDDLIRKMEEWRDEPFWLGIAGPPGSGKSTLASALANSIGDESVVIPMDGYHFTRARLNQMEDPELAHRRRGAPFTFDSNRFVRELQEAKRLGKGLFPSFDHGKGDPVERDIEWNRENQRLIIVEGNYLLLDLHPWVDLNELFDESWYLDIEEECCLERVKNRMVENGVSLEMANARVEDNDRANFRLVSEVSPKRADRVINAVRISGGTNL